MSDGVDRTANDIILRLFDEFETEFERLGIPPTDSTNSRPYPVVYRNGVPLSNGVVKQSPGVVI